MTISKNQGATLTNQYYVIQYKLYCNETNPDHCLPGLRSISMVREKSIRRYNDE